jgi:di/tricarboxylate transporter
MTPDIALLLMLVVVVIGLFVWDKIEADIVALGLMITLFLAGLLPPDRVFEGFGSNTVMMILGLLILNAALLRTGVIELAGRFLLGLTESRPRILLAVILAAASGLSAFISNTAAAAFFLPVVLGITRRSHLPPGKFLLPLAFACILTSSVSLISTSTNLVINGLMQQAALPGMGMFELAPVGIPIAIAGLLYVFFIGPYLLPRQAAEEKESAYGSWPYLTEVVVLPGSPLIGQTLGQSGLGRDLDLTIVRIIRGKNDSRYPHPDIPIRENDILLVEALREDLLNIKETKGIDIRADVKFSDPALQSDDHQFVEVLLLPGCGLLGRTLRSFRFRERFNLRVLGINRSGETIQSKLSHVVLRTGDILLVEGEPGRIRLLDEEPKYRILSQYEREPLNRKRAFSAVGIFIGAILLATFEWVALPIAVLLGVVGVFIAGCISPRDAYREVEWKAVILIGCMLSLGVAMEYTGTAKYLAGKVVEWMPAEQPYWLLGGFFLLTVLLTQPMSNQAAAILVIPIAIQTALAAGLNPRTFCMMIAVAASCSYLTPLEPACLMVYGPGKYRFSDFVRVGAPLTLIIFALALWLVPIVWPF